jgi:hypothetical protein
VFEDLVLGYCRSLRLPLGNIAFLQIEICIEICSDIIVVLKLSLRLSLLSLHHLSLPSLHHLNLLLCLQHGLAGWMCFLSLLSSAVGSCIEVCIGIYIRVSIARVGYITGVVIVVTFR